jgi:hypothetical protein
MKGRTRTLLVASLLALAPACATPSEVGLAPWDQARVTMLSREILAATNGWQLSLLQQGRGSGRLQMNSRAIQEQAATLAAHLEAGQGFAETVYSYRDLREMLDDAHEGVDRTFIEEPTNRAWERLGRPMSEITPYYDKRPFGQ